MPDIDLFCYLPDDLRIGRLIVKNIAEDGLSIVGKFVRNTLKGVVISIKYFR